jgi:hypothetical protein
MNKRRKLPFRSHKGLTVIDLDDRDVLELLQNIICLLEKNNNYYIAFSQLGYDSPKDYTFDYMIKEKHAVLIEFYKPSDIKQAKGLSINEPALVKAFEDYFNEQWASIPPINKEKNEVVVKNTNRQCGR